MSFASASLRAARVASASAGATAPRRSAARAASSWLPGKGGEQWCPGAEVPKHLDGSLPGDYGYDPLNLGADPGALDRYREAELMHSRWCMLAVVGLTLPESLGMGSWDAAPKWMIEGGKPEYWIIGEGPWPQVSVPAVLSFQLLTMGLAEGYRMKADYNDRIYPGGAFDPFGYAKGDVADLKEKEIVHGRLAMLAVIGCFAQTAATGMTPLEALGSHVADPWHTNVGQIYSVGPTALNL